MPHLNILSDKPTIGTPVWKLVVNDNNTHVIIFTVDRYNGGVDLSDLGWDVAMTNAAGVSDMHPLEILKVDDSRITLKWVIHGAATAQVGQTLFQLQGRGAGPNSKVWQSGTRVLDIQQDIQAQPSGTQEQATQLDILINKLSLVLPQLQQQVEQAIDTVNDLSQEFAEQKSQLTQMVQQASQSAASAAQSQARAQQAAQALESISAQAQKLPGDADPTAQYDNGVIKIGVPVGLNSQTKNYVDNGLDQKQDVLISGTNIKTVNGQNLLGDGDIKVAGGGGVQQDPEDPSGGIVVQSTLAAIDKTLTVQGDAAQSKTVGDKISALQNGKLDSISLFDAGIKSISWSTVRSQITVTTVQDIYKQYRPSGTDTRYWLQFEGCPYFKNRQMYRVTFDGTAYDNIVCDYGIIVDDGTGSIIGTDTSVGGCWNLIGNKHLYDSRYEDTSEPFCILYVQHGGMHQQGSYYYSSSVGNGILLTASAKQCTLKIEKAVFNQNQLPASLFNNYGYGDKTYQSIENSAYARTSIGQGNVVGRGSFAIGISNISTEFAFSVGQNNKAYGRLSYAQGLGNESAGKASHAQGYETYSSGISSHSQGDKTKSSGASAHAQGQYTNAVASYSHAEGQYTSAKGHSSHVEGQANSAQAKQCHVQGAGNIVGDNMMLAHVQGVNSLDVNEKSGITAIVKVLNEDGSLVGNSSKELGKYAHVVGNGISDALRSNAHTLDWSGNAWYSGDVYVGSTSGTNRDDGSVKLAKITDIPQSVTIAQIDEYIGIGGD